MKQAGFTLAELLIALAILGVIATFTIPKVLNSQQNSTFNSIAKEAAASVSEAYQAYQLENNITSTTGIDDLTPYLNYVALVSNITVDHRPGLGSSDCSAVNVVCYKLHNGSVLWYATPFQNLGGTNSWNFMLYSVDPNGIEDGGDGLSVEFFIRTNGRIYTRAVQNNDPSLDPEWFSWN